MKPKPLHVAPAGMRWPWNPLYICDYKLEDGVAENGYVTVNITARGPVRHTRVGVKRWAAHVGRVALRRNR